MSNSVQELFNVSDQLAKNLEISHKLAVPKISKIVINAGIGAIKEDNKAIEKIKKDLSLITGQSPVVRMSKKAIASFKVRKGMPVGVMVTLRGDKMYEFLDRFINIALPRTRDFRGVSAKGFDGRGNFNMGITEHIIFPEIDIDKVNKILGMDITFVTSTDSDEEAKALLDSFNFPFTKN